MAHKKIETENMMSPMDGVKVSTEPSQPAKVPVFVVDRGESSEEPKRKFILAFRQERKGSDGESGYRILLREDALSRKEVVKKLEGQKAEGALFCLSLPRSAAKGWPQKGTLDFQSVLFDKLQWLKKSIKKGTGVNLLDSSGRLSDEGEAALLKSLGEGGFQIVQHACLEDYLKQGLEEPKMVSEQETAELKSLVSSVERVVMGGIESEQGQEKIKSKLTQFLNKVSWPGRHAKAGGTEIAASLESSGEIAETAKAEGLLEKSVQFLSKVSWPGRHAKVGGTEIAASLESSGETVETAKAEGLLEKSKSVQSLYPNLEGLNENVQEVSRANPMEWHCSVPQELHAACESHLASVQALKRSSSFVTKAEQLFAEPRLQTYLAAQATPHFAGPPNVEQKSRLTSRTRQMTFSTPITGAKCLLNEQMPKSALATGVKVLSLQTDTIRGYAEKLKSQSKDRLAQEKSGILTALVDRSKSIVNQMRNTPVAQNDRERLSLEIQNLRDQVQANMETLSRYRATPLNAPIRAACTAFFCVGEVILRSRVTSSKLAEGLVEVLDNCERQLNSASPQPGACVMK